MAKAVHFGGPEALVRARFIERLNRFSVLCEIEGTIQKAYLPNPGRLWELLLPGTTLYVEARDTRWTVWAAEKNGHVVMLHTHYTNRVVQDLLKKGMIGSLRGLRPVKSEVTFGHSRFDLLLADRQREFPLEVKSCTLFRDTLAMFPDAVSRRALRHIETLATVGGGVLFLVHNPRARAFLPEFHTDPEFAQALYHLRHQIIITAVAVKWNKDLSYTVQDELTIPWHIYETHGQDRGGYFLILELSEEHTLEVGTLGRVFFPCGFYIYVGSAMVALSKRLARHLRRPKTKHWHIDYLTAVASKIRPVPVRSAEPIECAMAEAVQAHFKVIEGFGATDCRCPGHLFYSPEDPLKRPEFVDIVMEFRIGRLEKQLPKFRTF